MSQVPGSSYLTVNVFFFSSWVKVLTSITSQYLTNYCGYTGARDGIGLHLDLTHWKALIPALWRPGHSFTACNVTMPSKIQNWQQWVLKLPSGSQKGPNLRVLLRTKQIFLNILFDSSPSMGKSDNREKSRGRGVDTSLGHFLNPKTEIFLLY